MYFLKVWIFIIRCHPQVSKADRNLVTLVVLTLRRFEYMIMGGAKSNLPIFEAQLLKFLRDPFPKRVRNNLRSKRFLHFSLVKTFLFYARTHRRNSIVLILAHTEIGSVDGLIAVGR